MSKQDFPWPPTSTTTPLAVLVSGGLDSAILLGEAVRVYPAVHPIYVRVGSFWEPTEEAYLRRFLAALDAPNLYPLTVLEQPIADVYGSHWSLNGESTPGADSADEAVFLPGRNVLLLAKPILWCHLNGIREIATAPLVTNPFPDATDEFYDGIAGIVSRAVAGNVRVLRPYATLGLRKVDVMRRGRGMSLEETFSCIHPIGGLHCGECNKCAERQLGFAAAEMPDPTHYATLTAQH
jgi:7-cyano-7-deazaguanine synthase